MELRIKSGFGRHMEKRYEAQKKYAYYDTCGNRIEAWKLLACGTYEFCESVINRERIRDRKR